MVPQVELCNVTNEGLGGIKSAPQGILGQERNKERRETWGERRRAEAIQPGPYLPKLGSQGSSSTQGSYLPRLQPHSQGSSLLPGFSSACFFSYLLPICKLVGQTRC